MSDETITDMQSLLESFPEGIIFLDRAWKVTYINESGRKISRISDEHLNGPTHWELYPATVGTELERTYRRAMEERIILDHAFYYEPFDIWLSTRTLPIPSGIAVHYRDISRLMEAESKQEASNRQLEQVFEATSDAILMLDRDYRIVFQNRRGKELLSAGGDMMGKNLFEAYPHAVFEGSPYVANYRRAMEERVSGRFEAFYGEPFNFWLSVEALPAEDGIIIFFRDISRHRAAAEELRLKSVEMERQAAEIEAVYRTAPIGLALFDAEEFRYRRLNDRQAAFFGLKPEQVVGSTLTEMAPIPGLQELFEQVRAGTPVINYPLEGELVSHPGEHRYWTVNYTPVRGPDGTVQAISAASLEITAQKKAEKALIQSEKLAAVGRLASSISHEINNPLESVTNLLYLIAQDGALSPDLRGYVELAQAELTRVSQIATQTLRFHRQTARPVQVTARQIIEPLLKLYQGRLLNSGVAVETRFATETTVLCLENEMRQVLSNLLGNAIDAMRTGGRLLLRSHDVRGASGEVTGLRITVADNGQGISDASMKRIFEPFFTTKDINGTGLGLWVSAEIVERHRGRFHVRSSQDERWRGTVFWLELPLAGLGGGVE